MAAGIVATPLFLESNKSGVGTKRGPPNLDPHLDTFWIPFWTPSGPPFGSPFGPPSGPPFYSENVIFFTIGRTLTVTPSLGPSYRSCIRVNFVPTRSSEMRLRFQRAL